MADKILATFRIDPEEWEDFKNQASADGFTASSVLVDLVRWYVRGNRISNQGGGTGLNLDKIKDYLYTLIDKKLENMAIKPVDDVYLQELVKQEVQKQLGELPA